MKALFYGGAFNPLTRAHTDLADYARKELGAQAVIFMPTKSAYIRRDENKDYVIEDEIRLDLLRQAAETRPWMIVSEMELKEEEQPRTYHTLCRLRDQGYELQLLIGSDWLKGLEHGWRYIKEITEEFGIAVMTRNQDDTLRMIEEDPYLSSISEYLRVIHTPELYREISSTKVRELLKDPGKNSEQIRQYMPEGLDLSALGIEDK